MASKKRDYYEILGLSRNASLDDIKRAFRKLAKEHHPDKGGNDDKFKEISEAYQKLSDPKTRQMYDQFGHEGASQGSHSGFEGFSAGGFSDIGSMFGDLFGDIFGGGRRNQHSQRNAKMQGDNILTRINIDFKDVFFGKKMTISLNIEVPCDACNQTGAKSTSDITTCEQCHGKGIVEYIQRSPLGVFKQQGVCNQCQGLGKIVRQKCLKCKGHTYYLEKQNLEFEIPRSIADGQQIRIKGKGKIGHNGGPNGDLFVAIHIKNHPFLERQGSDLYIKLPVSYLDVILGNVVMIPTFEGVIKEKLALGLQYGDKVVIKNKGLYYPNSNRRGDLFVILDIQFPNKITKSEQEKLWNINNETKFDPNEDFANSASKRI